MEFRIREIIKDVIGDIDFAVERPGDMAHGDYATNAALIVAKKEGKNPREVADDLAGKLRSALGERVDKVEAAGPGFVNITLSKSAVNFLIAEADAKGEEWGRSQEKKEKVMIEYGNPNAFKEMHIGHMMGSIIGEALARLIESTGAMVARDTFGGDVGPNVAKTLWALRKEGITDIANAQLLGVAYAQGSRAYEEDAQAKAEIDALNKEIYEGKDEALMDLWRKGREVSMEEFRRIWQILGIKFDFELFDSDTTASGLRLVRDGLEKGIFKENDGAIIYDGEAKKVHTMVFITSHHTPTYEAKDIGLAFLREERYSSDRVIIVTGNEQTGRFKTVLAALGELAPKLAKKTIHIAHGFLRLTSGKMSSREGNVITAAQFINEVIAKASEKNPDPLIAQMVAVGAIKYMILRQSPGSDIVYDAEKSLSLEGDSGLYLQYALVRAVKILAYSSEDAGEAEEPTAPYPIERLIIHYPEVVARAARELAPNVLTTYLTELAGAWNSFYATEQVLGSREEQYKQRLTRAFAHTMANGLTLLGIPTPERM